MPEDAGDQPGEDLRQIRNPGPRPATATEVRYGNRRDVWLSPSTAMEVFRKNAALALEYLGLGANGTSEKRGAVDLEEGEQSAGVAFAAAFSVPPTNVKVSVEMPDGDGAVLFASFHTVTAAGFTFVLSNPPPASGYRLHWEAKA